MISIEKPESNEREIVGQWVEVNGKVVGDAVCERIDSLTETHLEKIGFSEYGAWETLYRDPGDGRFWERNYPHGEWHGGGPPALINLSEAEAKDKYPDLFK